MVAVSLLFIVVLSFVVGFMVGYCLSEEKHVRGSGKG